MIGIGCVLVSHLNVIRSNEHSLFHTRREYVRVGSSKGPSFDGLKQAVSITAAPRSEFGYRFYLRNL